MVWSCCASSRMWIGCCAPTMFNAWQHQDAGASVGLAALLESQVPPEPEKTTVLVITGGNLDLEQVSQCL